MKVKLLLPLFALLFSITTFSQTLNQPNDMIVCDDNNDGFADFDVESQTSQILGNLNPNDYSVSYHENQTDTDQQLNPIVSPYTNTTNPQTLYVAVLENTTGNLETFSFDLIINTLVINGFAQDVIACDEGGGFGIFDLTQFDNEFSEGNPDLIVSYFETFQGAASNESPIMDPSFYINTVPYFQTIYVRIEDSISGCFYVGDNTVLYLNVQEQPIINQPTPYVVCDDDDDGFFVFDLDTKTAEIAGPIDNPTIVVTYHETQSDAENGTNAISGVYTNIVVSIQTIFVRVSSGFGNCHQTTTLELIVESDCLSIATAAIGFCTDDPNFVGDFDLTSQNNEIVNGQDVSGFNFSYFLTEADAVNQNNAITNPTAYQSNIDTLIIYVYVEEIATGDSAITTLTINGNLNPQVDFNGPYAICSGQEIVLTPFVNGNSGQYTYIWSTGDTDPEIVVFTAGSYSVTVTDPNTGCMSFATVDVTEGDAVEIVAPQDLTSCGNGTGIFDLTSIIPEVLNGVDPSTVEIAFYNNFNDVFNQVNTITNPGQYTAILSPETIFIRVNNFDNDCFAFADFSLISENCPAVVTCGQDPINTTYCYALNDATQYTYASSDGSPLQVFFNAGQVEVDWDELYVIDSDGVTNLNPEATTYGNNGDLAGLVFTSTGDSITVYVDSDDIFACANQNYTPIDYNVSCADPNALPNCVSVLTTPEDGATNINENMDLTWTASSGVVNGYKISLGITSGGTEVLDHLDVGNVLTYDVGTLDFEITYYATIIPYNDNGDAEGCTEESFTTRVNPNQLVDCDNGALNTTYCYGNNDTSEFAFESSDGLPLTLVFNTGATEVNFDTITIVDSDGSILNPNLPYGNAGSFSGLSYTSLGSSISVLFDTDGSVSCQSGSTCCTEQFDFDVFCASSVGLIQVNAFVDTNTNTLFDTNEPSFSNGYFTYEMNNDGTINTVNSSTGSFQIISEDETDTYDITFNLYEESAGCYDVTIPVFNAISVATGNTVTADFPIVEAQSCEDLAVYLINYWVAPRPGFTHENHLILENLGFTTIASGTVEFVADSQLIFNSVTNVNPNYTITSTATGFTVDFLNLQPGDYEDIEISLTCPASVALGDIVTNTATYITDSNDLVASNNYSTLSELVVGSWDPNDKMEAHGPHIVFDDFATSDEYLYYTIRFQNLGTAAATFIRIDDALDNQLDETTFQMLRSSHDYVVTRTATDLEWFFDDINLPAEEDDAIGSQGFVYFRIKPKAGYAIGDVIPNTAAIYFDYNAAVITNRFDSEFVEESLSVSEIGFTSFDMYPNPAKDNITIEINASHFGNVTINIVDLQGKLILKQRISGENLTVIDVSGLHSGLYFVKLDTNTKSLVKKLVIE